MYVNVFYKTVILLLLSLQLWNKKIEGLLRELKKKKKSKKETLENYKQFNKKQHRIYIYFNDQCDHSYAFLFINLLSINELYTYICSLQLNITIV